MATGRYLGFLGKDCLSQRMKAVWVSRICMALLAKQAWRVIQKPSSLLSRLYKGRYHRSSTFLESVCGKNPSYGWRSIQAGKNLLQKGLRVRVDNGKETNVWLDHWLPTLPPRKVQGQRSTNTEYGAEGRRFMETRKTGMG